MRATVPPSTHPTAIGDHQATTRTAIAVTASPVLATDLVKLHPQLRTGLLTRLTGIGTLRNGDALLILTTHDSDGQHARTVYVATDPAAGVATRARRLHADDVLVMPRHGPELAALLLEHLGKSA